MTIAPPSQQPLLLHIPPTWHITKNAQARNAYGTVAQELVCACLGLTPVPINGNYECCFDAWCPATRTHYEIKSVRARSGKVVIYDWRMAKEQQAAPDLHYAVLCHNVRGSDGKALVQDFVNGGLELLVLPACDVHRLAAVQPLRKLLRLALDPRNGYNRNGYKDGYRNVPVAALRELCPVEQTHTFTYASMAATATVRSA